MRKECLFRLTRHITFLEDELKDHEKFKLLTWEDYNHDRSKRRDVERWVENIVNSCIDIAKTILASEGLPIADTYKEIVVSLSLVPGFEKETMEKLSEWVRLRNIIVHEYLDIRWSFIKRFVLEAKTLYGDFLYRAKKYIELKMKG